MNNASKMFKTHVVNEAAAHLPLATIQRDTAYDFRQSRPHAN